MEEKELLHTEDTPVQSIYSRNNWPYTDVEEEIRDKNSEDKPYGPFHVWIYQLDLNINNEEDLEKSHLLLCVLNFAALHDNKIEDTRDFLGFFWWYVEKIKPLPNYKNSEKRKTAYHDMIVQILARTNYLFIDLFSPIGDIYSVLLFPSNYSLNDYAAIKIKLERLYINMNSDFAAGFFIYEDLKEMDESFYNSLGDREIYQTYIQEFFLYELTPEKIRETKESQRFALIKVPAGQKLLMPAEYLNQLTWLSFIKLQQCFYNPDGSVKSEKVLSFIIEKVNDENIKHYNSDQVLCLMKDMDSLGTENDFWKRFLDVITTVKPQELNGPENIHLYAFLLSAVLPEKIESGLEEEMEKEADIREDDIGQFYIALNADRTANYTFASFIKMFPEFPFAVRYRRREKQFIEKALDELINNKKITKLREPGQKNISHFIVTKNIIYVFIHSIEEISNELNIVYQQEFNNSMIHNEAEFRLDLEKRIFKNYPLFYQLYVKKEFADYIYRILDKTGTGASEKYKSRLFIASADTHSFLPLSELLGLKFDQFHIQEAPADHNIQGPSIKAGLEAKSIVLNKENNKKEQIVQKMPVNIQAEKEISGRNKKENKSLQEKGPVNKPEAIKPEVNQGPLDLLELILMFFNKMGKGFKNMSSGFSKSMFSAIEKDMARKNKLAGMNMEKKKVRTSAKIERHKDEEKEKGKNKVNEADVEISLRAIAGNMIEDFMGSKELQLGEAVKSLADIWNDPKTLNEAQLEPLKRENLVKMNALIKNNTRNLNINKINRAAIEEKAAEIANFHEVDDIIKKIAQKKETREIIRRYIALGIAAILIKK